MVKPFQGTAKRVYIDFDKDNPFVFEGYQSVAVPPEGDPTHSISDPSHKSTCKKGYCDGEGGLLCADGKCVDVVKMVNDKIARRKKEEAAKKDAAKKDAAERSEAQQIKPGDKR